MNLLMLTVLAIVTTTNAASIDGDFDEISDFLDGLEAKLNEEFIDLEKSRPNNGDAPNILFVVADDLGYHDVGYNNDEVISETLDQLAGSGVILNHNYLLPVCTPSRHALMTGRYPHKTKMQHGVFGEDTPHCSPTNIKFLSQRLKDVGYTTYGVGKWHLGFCQQACMPLARGFDHYYGFLSGASDYYNHTAGSRGAYDWRNDNEVDRSVRGKYHTDIVKDYVLNALDTHDNSNPFFVYLAFANVHIPLQVPQRYADMYPNIESGRKEYLGMLTAMDEAIGEIVQALKTNGQYENTIIIFTSDNGGESGGNADNGPLRGCKGSLFEGGTRVVGFVHSPLLEVSGYTHDGLFHGVDWTRTLMSIVGAPVESEVDGYDQSDMIVRNGPSRRTEIIYNIDKEPGPQFGQSAIQSDGMKLIWGPYGYADGRGRDFLPFFMDPDNSELTYEGDEIANTPLVTRNTPAENRYEHIHINPQYYRRIGEIVSNMRWTGQGTESKSTVPVYLFNLTADPYEQHNLAADRRHADLIEQLKNKIRDEDYVEPPALASERWAAQANTDNFNGAVSPGWCEDLVITV